jgi:hypothetical protein
MILVQHGVADGPIRKTVNRGDDSDRCWVPGDRSTAARWLHEEPLLELFDENRAQSQLD